MELTKVLIGSRGSKRVFEGGALCEPARRETAARGILSHSVLSGVTVGPGHSVAGRDFDRLRVKCEPFDGDRGGGRGNRRASSCGNVIDLVVVQDVYGHQGGAVSIVKEPREA